MSNAGGTTSYLYNGLEQRVRKSGSLVPTGQSHYLYDEAGRLLGEYDAHGELEHSRVANAGARSGLSLGSAPGSVLHAFAPPSDRGR